MRLKRLAVCRRSLPNGDQVTTFSVATTDKWKDKTSEQIKGVK
jgi:hypothetical protein